jgi:CBS domain-containing protein
MRATTVGSVMTTAVVTGRPETTVKELVALMSGHRVSGLPVVDTAGRPVGVVSEADVLVRQERRGTATRPWLGRARRDRWRKATGVVAADLMTSPPVTVGAGTTVTAAARLMAAKDIRRLCVVDGDGGLVGVVSRRDVIGTFLRPDAEIRAEIEEQVFRKGMWPLPGGGLTVEVVDGVAVLAGAVERRTTAQIAAQLTHAVPGVVAVRNDVRHEVDDTVTSPL